MNTGVRVGREVALSRRLTKEDHEKRLGSKEYPFLAGEQAVLILTGLGIGTALGFVASALFIPYFQVGSDKAALVPPFIVQIAWSQLGTIYAIFAVMFVVAVVVLSFLLVRMKIFEAVKMGEAI